MNWMSILGLILIGVGTVFSFFGTYHSDKKGHDDLKHTIREKNKEIDNINSTNGMLLEQNHQLLISNNDISTTNRDLFDQNRDMLLRVDKYQGDIEAKNKKIQELEGLAQKAERGIVSIIQYDGSYLEKRGGSTIVSGGTAESKIYKQIKALAVENKFPEILVLCDKSIITNPNWYTAYLYKAVSLLNIDINKNKGQAIKLLELIESKTYGDPDYTKPLASIYLTIGDKQKHDELIKTLSK